MTLQSRTSRPFGRPSPERNEIDLAKLLERVAGRVVEKKTETAYAAVALDCAGNRRASMFDADGCLPDNPTTLCLAERRDGVTWCVDLPAAGNAAALTVVDLTVTPCEPVTGWYFIDGAGALYRVPAALREAVPFWPFTAAWPPTGFPPAGGESLLLSRAGFWSRLTCGAALEIPINGDKGGSWIGWYEGTLWVQAYDWAILLNPEPTSYRNAGILWRDRLEPNAGSRVVGITLPAAPEGIASGPARVAYGYALAYWCDHAGPGDSSAAPYAVKHLATLESDTRGRVFWDSALCYGLRLAVDYGRPAHVNLSGAAIADPGDSSAIVSPLSADLAPDAKANLVPLPNGEVALFAAGSTSGKRYRIRPAVTERIVAEFVTLPRGDVWGEDPNPFTIPNSFNLAPWEEGDTSLTLAHLFDGLGGEHMPRRDTRVRVFQSYLDPEAGWVTGPCKWGVLVAVAGDSITIDYDEGGGAPAYVEAETTYHYLEVYGVFPKLWYGWTAVIRTHLDSGGHVDTETALSPLVMLEGYGRMVFNEDGSLNPSESRWCNWYDSNSENDGGASHSVRLTIPAGPEGTLQRRLYRFALQNPSATPDVIPPPNPWHPQAQAGGAVYDRMMRLSQEIPGAAEVQVYDTDTNWTFAGTRPPDPLVGPYLPDLEVPPTASGDAPPPLLPPVNLE